MQWVYPRVDGGTLSMTIAPFKCKGLSPRGRGNPHRFLNAGMDNGVYPRVDGGTSIWNDCSGLARSIPAWTGEPHPRYADDRARRVYPRVDGGTTSARQSEAGLSPRGRGNPRIGPLTVYPRVDGGTVRRTP